MPRQMTPRELREWEQELARTRRYERGRPPTAEEREQVEKARPHTRVWDGSTELLLAIQSAA